LVTLVYEKAFRDRGSGLSEKTISSRSWRFFASFSCM